MILKTEAFVKKNIAIIMSLVISVLLTIIVRKK